MLFNFLELFVAVLAFLFLFLLYYCRHSTVQQYSDAAAVYLKCIYLEKSEECYSHITHVQPGDALHSAPIE